MSTQNDTHCRERPCPVCNGRERAVLYQQQFAALSSQSLLDGYTVVACNGCGFCFADYIPVQDAFDQYYASMSKYENPSESGRESDYDRRRFETIADVIERLIPDRSARIVEFGCATGGLLARLKRIGFSSLRGIDPSPASSEIAARLHGISVSTGNLFDLPREEAAADMLLLIGVLEHIRDLDVALIRLQQLLAPRGQVFLTVPDASQYVNGCDAPFQEFSVEHINFFGPQSVVNLLSRGNFSLVALEQSMLEVAPHTITPVVHALFKRDPDRELQWTKDEETAPALCRYIERSRSEDEGIRVKIAAIAATGLPLIVWGTGAHTLRLMQSSALGSANIVAFVDSNPHYQGKLLNNAPIIAPEQLGEYPVPVLISSRVYQTEIAEQIRCRYNFQNKLLLLYRLPGDTKDSDSDI